MYCVFAFWVLSAAQFIVQPIAALSTVLLAIFGTYLLQEDPQLAKCYEALRQSVLGQCCGSGGLAMLLPFLAFSSMSSLLDGVQLLQLFAVAGTAALAFPAVDVLLLIFAIESLSTVLSY